MLKELDLPAMNLFFRIGLEGGDHVLVEHLVYAGEGCFNAQASVHVGGFHGRHKIYLDGEDILVFARQVENLYRALKGNACFSILEGEIEATLTANWQGHIKVEGHLRPNPSTRTALEFDFDTDQSTLPETMRQLETCCEYVRTKPGSMFGPRISG